MRPLRYSINVTLDGCYDHRFGIPSEEIHQHATKMIRRADALLFGRVTYQLMEEAWRPPSDEPFAQAISQAHKYVVSSTLDHVDWNSELLTGDLRQAVIDLKNQPGEGIYVGGVQLPMALAQMGLIDEYTIVVHPRIVGHGPALFAGLEQPLDLKLVESLELGDGAVALTYVSAG